MSKKLKPCPFCGGEPGITCFLNNALIVREVYIYCPQCGTSIQYDFCSQDEAIEHWNRRANP